jgi:hypothetical protein
MREERWEISAPKTFSVQCFDPKNPHGSFSGFLKDFDGDTIG